MFKYLVLITLSLMLNYAHSVLAESSAQSTFATYESTLPEYTVVVSEAREKTGMVTLVVTMQKDGMELSQTLAGADEPKGPVYCGSSVCADQQQAVGLIRLALGTVYTDEHLASRILVN